MPTCYKHQQHYTMDEYCIYCGNPVKVTTAPTTPPSGPTAPSQNVGRTIQEFQERHHRKPSGEEMSAMFL